MKFNSYKLSSPKLFGLVFCANLSPSPGTSGFSPLLSPMSEFSILTTQEEVKS